MTRIIYSKNLVGYIIETVTRKVDILINCNFGNDEMIMMIFRCDLSNREAFILLDICSINRLFTKTPFMFVP